METAAASGAESEDTVRILKDIRDEIRHARDELRAEIRGVRTERVDRSDRGRKTRAALIAAIVLSVLAAGLLFSRERGTWVERESVALELPAAPASPTVAAASAPWVAHAAPPTTAAAAPAPPAAPAVATQVTAKATPKRAPVHHKVHPPTEAELEEPAKL